MNDTKKIEALRNIAAVNPGMPVTDALERLSKMESRVFALDEIILENGASSEGQVVLNASDGSGYRPYIAVTGDGRVFLFDSQAPHDQVEWPDKRTDYVEIDVDKLAEIVLEANAIAHARQ